ncbi:ribonuclease P protein component 1 [Halospeciosus flavus]|uniref:Ribonuclease P protein component 1 n=1 Tax=Halospeciosus flavus TaxID=3032283 RepID=A0ABD5Z917_9EURY|nr:ribonuclease P protein component 1 [Halospeciosus flavus]
MALTPETLPRHELAGLHVRVVESTDPSKVGIEGTVVEETMRTLLVATEATDEAAVRASGATREQGDGVKRVPKGGTTFEFLLTDETAADRKEAGTTSERADSAGSTREDVAYVTVDGGTLLSRPALRTENGAEHRWQ